MDYVEKFIEDRGVASRTASEYRVPLRHLCKRRDPTSLTHKEAANWVSNMRRQGKSPHTIKKYRNAAGMFMLWMIQQEHHPGPNPMHGIRVKCPPPVPDRYVSVEELDLILDACPVFEGYGSKSDHSWANAFALARLAGLRVNEIRGLSADDVDFKQQLVHIRPAQHSTKQSTRDVPMSAALADRLVVSNGVKPCNQLPHDLYDPRLKFSARKILELAGLEYRKPFHSLRASCERDWLDNPDLNIMTACYWMGHSPTVAARHYVRPTPRAYAAAQAQGAES